MPQALNRAQKDKDYSSSSSAGYFIVHLFMEFFSSRISIWFFSKFSISLVNYSLC